MKEVLVQYVKTGQVVAMKQHFADILVKVKHVTLYNPDSETLQKPEAAKAPAATRAQKKPTGAQKNKPGRKPGKGKQTYLTRDLTAQDI